MSKKNRRNRWANASPTEPRASASVTAAELTIADADSAVSQEFSRISSAQLAANRANAQLSTGPRTAAGLAKSSLNALKCGLTGRTVLLPTEDVAEYEQHMSRYYAEFSPVSQRETDLASGPSKISHCETT
jgi:hypothetical protein